jgi:hypothetical protein
MEKRAAFISSMVKGRTNEAAWEEVREVERTRDERSRLSEERTGVPRRSRKKPWRMVALPR